MTHEQIPLHQLQPTTRFSDRAVDYAKYRPGYPSDAIAAIVTGLQPSAVVADIGAGTGISSRLLAEVGMEVLAIEPNLAMQQVAEPHPQVSFSSGMAEATGLADQSVDLVTCFQSFHWFDPDQCLAEFQRILKPGGRLAVVWNERDRQDPITQRYSQIIRTLSNQHPAEQRMVEMLPLYNNPYFSNVQQFSYTNYQSLDLMGLIGRAQSVSYLPQDLDANTELINQLTALYDQFVRLDNRFRLTYQTIVYLSEVFRKNSWRS